MKYLVLFSEMVKEKFIVKIDNIKIHNDKLMESPNEKVEKLVEIFLDTTKIYSKYDAKDDKGNYIKVYRDEARPLEFPSVMHVWVDVEKIKDNDIDVAFIQEFPSDDSAHLFALATL